jgi:hypothetical protein
MGASWRRPVSARPRRTLGAMPSPVALAPRFATASGPMPLTGHCPADGSLRRSGWAVPRSGGKKLERRRPAPAIGKDGIVGRVNWPTDRHDRAGLVADTATPQAHPEGCDRLRAPPHVSIARIVGAAVAPGRFQSDRAYPGPGRSDSVYGRRHRPVTATTSAGGGPHIGRDGPWRRPGATARPLRTDLARLGTAAGP